jgi:hypothetical protein
MKGVKYLFDEKGVAEAVMIDLKTNRQVWEDFQDLLLAEERRAEPRESLDEVKAILQRKRKGNGKK